MARNIFYLTEVKFHLKGKRQWKDQLFLPSEISYSYCSLDCISVEA